jgi:hypothetical protein
MHSNRSSIKITNGVLDRRLRDLAPEETAAQIPLMLFSSVITRIVAQC